MLILPPSMHIVFAPLLLTAAIGAISQSNLPQDIFDFIQRYIFLGKPLDQRYV